MTSVAFYNNCIIILSISTILSYIIIYRAFKLHKRVIKLNDIFYLGHVFFLSVFIFFIYSYCFLNIKFTQEKKSFKKQLWKGDIETRSTMVDDLIYNNILRTKLETEVIDLLGKPIRTYNENKLIKLAYYVGFRNKPFAVDPELLIVEIKNGHVDKYYLVAGVPYRN